MRKILTVLLLLFSCNIYGQENDSWDIHSPINKEFRSLNRTGTCCWNSIYNCALQLGIEELYDIPDDRYCSGGATSSMMRNYLNSKKVKFKDANGKNKCRELILQAMVEGRPVIIFYGTAHCLNLVEYSEESNRVAIINNHQNNRYPLRMTVQQFYKNFKNYAMVLYGDAEDEKRLAEWRKNNRHIPLYYYSPKNALFYDNSYDPPNFVLP